MAVLNRSYAIVLVYANQVPFDHCHSVARLPCLYTLCSIMLKGLRICSPQEWTHMRHGNYLSRF